MQGSDDDDQEEKDKEMASSSPNAKKDMRLRSGRRKRRRSTETSGLTPPETAAKKSRTNRRKSQKKSQVQDEEEMEDDQMETRRSVARSSKRDSARFTDTYAVAAAQDPSISQDDEDSTLSPDTTDTNRRLFDGKPPGMPSTPATDTDEEQEKGRPLTPIPHHVQPIQKTPDNGSQYTLEEEETVSTRSSLPYRIFFMVVLSSLFFTIWPFCVQLADYIIPLKASSVISDTEVLKPEVIEEIEEIILEVEFDDEEETAAKGEKITASMAILERLGHLETIKKSATESRQTIGEHFIDLKKMLATLEKELKAKKTKYNIILNQLSDSEKVLEMALKKDDLSSSGWQEARKAAEAVGMTILDTSMVQLWNVPEPEECPEEGKLNSVVSPEVLDEQFGNLLLRARMTADEMINSEVAEELARGWIEGEIEFALEDHELASKAVAGLSAFTESDVSSIDHLREAIDLRLDSERADKTGEFDHASISNGAKVIYGGKRGTTKSLVDSLPIYNRLMQLAQLRFYGYGPEAAITPTYPVDALGQCWSFQQTPLKEILERRKSSSNEDDDNKHGNFGTLTIRLPKPVKVRSVVIEHPPKGLTDQIKSAIKAFRIIGYVDPTTEGESWTLGSFTYNINDKRPLQEFPVAQDVFGTPVPPLQSITLAIDSNWGLEYSCLYRFRVHGDGGVKT